MHGVRACVWNDVLGGVVVGLNDVGVCENLGADGSEDGIHDDVRDQVEVLDEHKEDCSARGCECAKGENRERNVAYKQAEARWQWRRR